MNQELADDLAAVRKRLASFYSQVTAGSLNNPPPGMAASNGWFVKFMREDVGLSNTQRPFQNTTEEGVKCGELAHAMMAFVRAGFNRDNYGANWMTDWDMLGRNLEALVPQLLQMSTGIATQILGDIPLVKIISGEVDKQIDQLAQSARQHGPTSGEHANGWISTDLQAGANQWLQEAENAKGAMASREAKDLIETLKVLATVMTKLNTGGHDPWLKAEWQIGFTAITGTAAQILEREPD